MKQNRFASMPVHLQIEQILREFDWELVYAVASKARLPWYRNGKSVKWPAHRHIVHICTGLMIDAVNFGGRRTYAYFSATFDGLLLRLDFTVTDYAGVPEALYEKDIAASQHDHHRACTRN